MMHTNHRRNFIARKDSRPTHFGDSGCPQLFKHDSHRWLRRRPLDTLDGEPVAPRRLPPDWWAYD